MIARCASSAGGEVVFTTIPPFMTWVEQAAWSLPMPSTSTMHIRHWPTIERRGW